MCEEWSRKDKVSSTTLPSYVWIRTFTPGLTESWLFKFLPVSPSTGAHMHVIQIDQAPVMLIIQFQRLICHLLVVPFTRISFSSCSKRARTVLKVNDPNKKQPSPRSTLDKECTTLMTIVKWSQSITSKNYFIYITFLIICNRKISQDIQPEDVACHHSL